MWAPKYRYHFPGKRLRQDSRKFLWRCATEDKDDVSQLRKVQAASRNEAGVMSLFLVVRNKRARRFMYLFRYSTAREGHMKSLLKSSNTLTAYVVGVLIAWAVIFAVGYFRNGSTASHPILHVFDSFLLGMLSMYIATRVYPSKRKDS